MPLEFRCDHCQKLLRTGHSGAGKKGKCPHCRELMDIPAPDDEYGKLRRPAYSRGAPPGYQGRPYANAWPPPPGALHGAWRPPGPAGHPPQLAPPYPPRPARPPDDDALASPYTGTFGKEPMSEGGEPADREEVDLRQTIGEMPDLSGLAPARRQPPIRPEKAAGPIQPMPPMGASPYADYGQWAQGGVLQRPHRGGMVLTFGVISLTLGVLGFSGCICPCTALPTGVMALVGLGFGIPAFALGHIDLAAMRKGEMDRFGQGTTQTGYILGIVGTSLSTLECMAALLWTLFYVADALLN